MIIIRILTCVLLGNFPPPTNPEELGARILIQERYEKYGESEEVEMEVESGDEEDERDNRDESRTTHADRDTQLQDMDEVKHTHTHFCLHFHWSDGGTLKWTVCVYFLGFWWRWGHDEGSSASRKAHASSTPSHTGSGHHSQGLWPQG